MQSQRKQRHKELIKKIRHLVLTLTTKIKIKSSHKFFTPQTKHSLRKIILTADKRSFSTKVGVFKTELPLNSPK